jgi:2-C-methyl-D-erythritol 4-phosphate cytidylyltransferase
VRVAGVVLAHGPDSVVGPGGSGLSPFCLLGGRSLLAWAVAALRSGAGLDQLVVVVGGCGLDVVDSAATLDLAVPDHGALVVVGERTRHGCVHRALSTLDSRVEVVVLHDACRPLAPPGVVSRVVGAVQRGAPVAVAVTEVTETVKRVDGTGRVESTVPRESLLRVQTPQAARRSLLEAAHAHCTPADLSGDGLGPLAPPDVEPVPVDGDPAAFPVADPADLALAEAVLARRPPGE